MDVNLNQSQCLITKPHIGYDRVHNVCSGSFVDVPWSFLDWFGFGALATVTLLAVVILAFFVWVVIND